MRIQDLYVIIATLLGASIAGCASDEAVPLQKQKQVGSTGEAFLFTTNAEPGSTLEIGVYVVKTGDTLVKIAAHFQTTVRGLQALNPDMKTTHISVGQQIRVYERKI
jgi:LysM repeat protein